MIVIIPGGMIIIIPGGMIVIIPEGMIVIIPGGMTVQAVRIPYHPNMGIMYAVYALP
jgi:hypothetical protein